MFDTELYQQVLGLTTPWKVTDVRLGVESTEIHVHVEHAQDCRWNCPQCSRELACYDHAPERQWRHLNTCQFHTLVYARVPRVECPEHGVVQLKVPWEEPHGRFTLLMERFVIDVLQACQTRTDTHRRFTERMLHSLAVKRHSVASTVRMPSLRPVVPLLGK